METFDDKIGLLKFPGFLIYIRSIRSPERRIGLLVNRSEPSELIDCKSQKLESHLTTAEIVNN